MKVSVLLLVKTQPQSKEFHFPKYGMFQWLQTCDMSEEKNLPIPPDTVCIALKITELVTFSCHLQLK